MLLPWARAGMKAHDVYCIYAACRENILPTFCFPLRFCVAEGVVNKYWVTGVFCVYIHIFIHISHKFLSRYIYIAGEKLKKVSTRIQQ